jgi:hypothetical protein
LYQLYVPPVGAPLADIVTCVPEHPDPPVVTGAAGYVTVALTAALVVLSYPWGVTDVT